MGDLEIRGPNGIDVYTHQDFENLGEDHPTFGKTIQIGNYFNKRYFVCHDEEGMATIVDHTKTITRLSPGMQMTARYKKLRGYHRATIIHRTNKISKFKIIENRA